MYSYLPDDRVGPNKRVGRLYCYLNLLFVTQFFQIKKTLSKLRNAVVTSALLLTFVLIN
jgi:hypothetical protein